MLKGKNIDYFCYVIFAITLIGTLSLYCFAPKSQESSQIQTTFAYENNLFDQSKVHTLDILMEDWDSFVNTCYDEKTVNCDVIIDGEHLSNVGLKVKGFSSVFAIAIANLDRYGFKITFDEFNEGANYEGLSSLQLSNVIQDATYMKDYLTYNMMRKMNVPAPLCSFINIKINGQDKGLYLAIEPLDENFLKRNYGEDYGNLYKPDVPFMRSDLTAFIEGSISLTTNKELEIPKVVAFAKSLLIGFDAALNFKNSNEEILDISFNRLHTDLLYAGDRLSTYANIFDTAAVPSSTTDQKRFIHALKALSDSNVPIEEVTDIDTLLRFLTVHAFVNNADSYIGSSPRNYYIYEKDGRLSFIPWDYNLSFSFNATAMPDTAFSPAPDAVTSTQDINWPIDTPVYKCTLDERPLIARIFKDSHSTAHYHQFYHVFLDDIINSGWLAHELTTAHNLIAPYVANDPTAFYTYEEFEKGCTTLNAYCTLRAESIAKQLDGTIPSTAQGQALDSSNFVDASSLDLSNTGYMSDALFFKLLSKDNATLVHNFDSLKAIVGIQEETSSQTTKPPMDKRALAEIIINFLDLNTWAMIIACFIAVIMATRFAKNFNKHK